MSLNENVHLGDVKGALHRVIKKTVQNIIKLRIQSKRKGFKNIVPRNEPTLKRVIAK